MIIKRHFLNHLIELFILLFILCGQPGNKRGPIQYGLAYPLMEIRGSDTITLEWNPSGENADSIESYELWYKTNNNQVYSFLKNVSASDSPSIVLHRDSISDPDSVFYFRVRTVMKSGLKSSYHYTTDSNAVPADGWFLLWSRQ